MIYVATKNREIESMDSIKNAIIFDGNKHTVDFENMQFVFAAALR
jgi:hypothetical protein